MRVSQRWLIAAGVALLVLAAPSEGRAQGMAVAGMRVGARVAPACSILADSGRDAGGGASVRVVCGRSALRALRVSSDSVDDVKPVVSLERRQQLAGGELVFFVPTLVTRIASLQPIASLSPVAASTTVVTLHF